MVHIAHLGPADKVVQDPPTVRSHSPDPDKSYPSDTSEEVGEVGGGQDRHLAAERTQKETRPAYIASRYMYHSRVKSKKSGLCIRR